MADSVHNSYKVIALFSKNFVNSPYCKYELDLAIHRLVKNGDNSLVVIRVDDVDSKKLPSELKEHGFIDWNSRLERPFWKSRLEKFLGLQQDSMTHSNNNNSDGYQVVTGQRPRFGRLESTNSNVSEISYV